MANTSNRRRANRIKSSLPIELQIDQQITVQGRLKDITVKSAFVLMKSSVYMEVNDEFRFYIRSVTNAEDEALTGIARVSRIAPGEGIAIYFTDMDTSATNRLAEMLNS